MGNPQEVMWQKYEGYQAKTTKANNAYPYKYYQNSVMQGAKIAFVKQHV